MANRHSDFGERFDRSAAATVPFPAQGPDGPPIAGLVDVSMLTPCPYSE